jgi:hypothetical protein
LDANPLRRDLDRVETLVTIVLVVAFVVVGPAISTAVGQSIVRAGMPLFGLGVGVLTWFNLVLVLRYVGRVVRRTLDRRRLARWERAWELVGPRWSGGL